MPGEAPSNRTTVQYNLGFAAYPLRATFAVLETVAPELGSGLALRLWCTPPRRRRRRARAAAPSARATGGHLPPPPPPDSGTRFEVSIAGRTVVARSWGSGPLVYLVHGWGGWWSQLQWFIPPLVAAGHRVVAFDALGHGESGPGALGGRRASGLEFATTLAAVVEAVGPAYAIVGHSLGGAASALAVLDGLPADRLVLVSAPADPLAFLGDFVSALGIGERTHAGLVARMRVLTDRPLDLFDIPRRAGLAAAGLPPVLVVHDRDDKEVHHTDGAAITAAWPGAELLATTGLGHRRIVRDRTVIDRVASFVAGRIVPGGRVEPGARVVPGDRVEPGDRGKSGDLGRVR